MPMVVIEIVLRDSNGNENIAGKLTVDDNPHPFDLPANKMLPINPGKCRLEARCAGRSINGENPREVQVMVPIDPNAPAQKVIFDVL
jgi:hypothetical protein